MSWPWQMRLKSALSLLWRNAAAFFARSSIAGSIMKIPDSENTTIDRGWFIFRMQNCNRAEPRGGVEGDENEDVEDILLEAKDVLAKFPKSNVWTFFK